MVVIKRLDATTMFSEMISMFLHVAAMRLEQTSMRFESASMLLEKTTKRIETTTMRLGRASMDKEATADDDGLGPIHCGGLSCDPTACSKRGPIPKKNFRPNSHPRQKGTLRLVFSQT